MASNWDDKADEATHVFENDSTDSAAVSTSERWYISADGRTKEVLEARAIIERARAGSLSDSTLVWRDGLSDWTRLDAVPELMQAVRAFKQSPSPLPAKLTPDAEVTNDMGVVATSHSPLAVSSLPPLPPLPAIPSRVGSAPEAFGGSPPVALGAPLPQPGLPSLRPATVTLTGAPLPPPPSLPPKPNVPMTTSDRQAPEVSSASPVAAPSGTGTVQEFAAAIISSVPARLAEAQVRISDFAARVHQVPKVGPVRGRTILVVAGAALSMWLLVTLLVGGDDAEEVGSAVSTGSESRASGGAAEANEASAVKRDPATAAASATALGVPPLDKRLAEAETLSLADLKPVDEQPGTGSEAQHGGQAFDVAAAKAALEAAAIKASRCKSARGPRGTGSVTVKIEPTGRVANVSLTTKAFENTEVGACVQTAFRQATVPPFKGDTKTVFKKFTVR